MLACVSLGAPNTLVRELSENVSWTPRKVLELYQTSSPLTTRAVWFMTHLQAWKADPPNPPTTNSPVKGPGG